MMTIRSDHRPLPDEFFAAMLQRLARVLEHVQLDGEQHAQALVAEMNHLVGDLELLGHGELAELARDALAEAWRWRRGDDAMDARVRLARLAGTLWRAILASAGARCGKPKLEA
jgi:hypothetical protein